MQETPASKRQATPQLKSDDEANSAVPARSEPRTPVEELQGLYFANPEHAAKFVACEPDVTSLVAVAWDANGRMYVVEMIGYPANADLGRAKRLDELDGDRRYETTTIYAGRLSFPTSVIPYLDGVFVTTLPDRHKARGRLGRGISNQPASDSV